jgi:hypothetical protein
LQWAYIKERILPVRIRTKTIRKAVRILEKDTYIVELLATSAKTSVNASCVVLDNQKTAENVVYMVVPSAI